MIKLKKKIILVVLSVFLNLCFSTSVYASTTTDKFKGTFISSYSFVDSTGHWGNFEYFQRKSDGEIAYCIQPGISLADSMYNGYSDLSMQEMAGHVSLTTEQLNKVSLIAYFGWGYQGHLGYDWIVATQSLIWRETGRDFQFTSQINPSNPYQYVIATPVEIQEKMNMIENSISEYLKRPSFGNLPLRFGMYDTSKYDVNAFSLEGYRVTNCENCTAYLSDNKLHLVVFNTDGKIHLKKEKKDWASNFTVYENSGGQNVLVPGNVLAVNAEVPFQIVPGTVKLKKYDADTKSCKAQNGGSLKGSIYTLYNEDVYPVRELEIDENCTANVSDLELSKYYIQETKAGKNYDLDSNQYYFDLTVDEPEKELVVYSSLLTGQIKILKSDSKTHTCKSSSLSATLKGAVYGIYKKDGSLVEKLKIDENCMAVSTDLLIGDYYIQEIKAPKGYKLDKEKYSFSITKDNAKTIVPLEVEDEIYESTVVIQKNFLRYNTPYPEEAEFDIYSKDKKVATIKTNSKGVGSMVLPYGEYIIKQSKGKENYRFVENVVFNIDEETSDTLLFSLVNVPFKGILELVKVDGATYSPLVGAIFDVCNENNYCTQIETDNTGTVVLDDLEFGEYFVKEVKAPYGYALSDEKYSFVIKKDNEVVPLMITNEQEVEVPSTLSNKNYYFILISFVFLCLEIGNYIYEKTKN